MAANRKVGLVLLLVEDAVTVAMDVSHRRAVETNKSTISDPITMAVITITTITIITIIMIVIIIMIIISTTRRLKN